MPHFLESGASIYVRSARYTTKKDGQCVLLADPMVLHVQIIKKTNQMYMSQNPSLVLK